MNPGTTVSFLHLSWLKIPRSEREEAASLYHSPCVPSSGGHWDMWTSIVATTSCCSYSQMDWGSILCFGSYEYPKANLEHLKKNSSLLFSVSSSVKWRRYLGTGSMLRRDCKKSTAVVLGSWHGSSVQSTGAVLVSGIVSGFTKCWRSRVGSSAFLVAVWWHVWAFASCLVSWNLQAFTMTTIKGCSRMGYSGSYMLSAWWLHSPSHWGIPGTLSAWSSKGRKWWIELYGGHSLGQVQKWVWCVHCHTIGKIQGTQEEKADRLMKIHVIAIPLLTAVLSLILYWSSIITSSTRASHHLHTLVERWVTSNEQRPSW